MPQIQFIDLEKDYTVIVECEDEDNLVDVARFEALRICSLIDREIKVKSEVRTWDSIREISVQMKDTFGK